MASLPLAPRLRGLRLSVPDGAAALAVFARAFAAAPRADRSASRWPRLQFGEPWLELRSAPGDTLDLHCSDLARQRTHLQRHGIEALDGSALGCTPCLRLEPVDTGACTVDLHEAPPRLEHAAAPTLEDDAAPGATRLCGLTLSVRSPERVVLHWAQLFHAHASRDAQGLPTLSLDRFDLRFALAADGRAAVTGMDFSAADMDALLREASSRGLAMRRETRRRAAFDALGIRFALRPAL